MDSVGRQAISDGVAHIKPEFILNDVVREADPSFLSDADREKLTKTSTPAAEQPNGNGQHLKLKGTNRQRKNALRDVIKICSFIVKQLNCPYGEKCRYSHKIEDYLATKPPDIGKECPNIKRIGACPFGITCRYHSGHSVVTSALSMKSEPAAADRIEKEEGYVNTDELNVITKDLQRKLRKRTFAMVAKEDGVKQAVKKSSIPEETLPELDQILRPTGAVIDEEEIRLRPEEKKSIDFRGKLYLSPLTTVGNLPFRRICKSLGADITCGEMALATNLLSGQQSEWALMVRHKSEDIFGVQVCGGRPEVMEKLAQVLKSEVEVDFVDINCGCPIDLVCNSGGGCALMGRGGRLESIVKTMSSTLDVPLTVKMRKGIQDGKDFAHELIPKLRSWGASSVSLHGRTREQRYSRLADWKYIAKCAEIADPMPLFGNGDCMNFEDYYDHVENSKIAGILIARGALIKPWIFTEIKERRHWDISAQERLDIFKEFVDFGLEHWGSDTRGVETTRRFLLE